MASGQVVEPLAGSGSRQRVILVGANGIHNLVVALGLGLGTRRPHDDARVVGEVVDQDVARMNVDRLESAVGETTFF